jgi:hypothetical protein
MFYVVFHLHACETKHVYTDLSHIMAQSSEQAPCTSETMESISTADSWHLW